MDNNPVVGIELFGLAKLSFEEAFMKSIGNYPFGIHLDLNPCIMMALLWKESNFDTTKKNPDSTAKGIAQIVDGTADDIQDRAVRGWGPSDPFYILAPGERFRNHRFDPDVSIYAAYIYLEDRYKVSGSLEGALRGYGPDSDKLIAAANCLCKCVGRQPDGSLLITSGGPDCLNIIHR